MNNFEVKQLSSRSLLPENIKFNLKYFQKPFCDSEPFEFKRYETIKFKSSFWKASNLIIMKKYYSFLAQLEMVIIC